MGDSAAALMRAGVISGRQADKHKLAVLKKTKVERPEEERFDGKQGLRDQGGGKEKGHGVARTKHIEGPDQGTEKKKNTGFNFDKRFANGKGSPGAAEINEAEHQKPAFPRSAGSTKSSKAGDGVRVGQEDVDEIDERDNQKPSFPREGRGRETGNKRAKGKIARSGPIYGGGGRNTQ